MFHHLLTGEEMHRNALPVGFVVLLAACGGRAQPIFPPDAGKDTVVGTGSGGTGGAGMDGAGSLDAPIDLSTDAPIDVGPGTDSGPEGGGACTPLNTVASCGPTCAACAPPAGGTPTCASGTCDFTCGSMKKCSAAGLCIAPSGCCEDSDCPMQSGRVGTCDTAKHACDYACAANMKACNGTCIAMSACCIDTDCAGTCQKCDTSHACIPATNVDDPTARCSGTCDAFGKCKSKQGQHCTSPTADGCVSGVTCVDTYCCNSACTGSCLACDVAGAEGTCTPVASGAPHGGRTACVGAGTVCGGSCGGRGDGACAYPMSKCGVATCSGSDRIIDQGTCNAGACLMPAAKVCANAYACTSGACKTTCMTNADCQVGNFCSSHSCNPIVPVSIAAGMNHACALISDGTVRCWGDNNYQQLGNPTVSGGAFKPVAVLGFQNAIQVGAGGRHTCVVLSDNTVRCWGENDWGQLGTGASSSPSATPMTAVGVTGATAVIASFSQSCAVISMGKVSCWGDANSLGNGSALDAPSSPVILPNLSAISSLSRNDGFGCATTTLGVWCWGRNEFGRLGMDPDVTMDAYTPTMTAANILGGKSIAAGRSFACVVRTGGDVSCWGEDPSRSLNLQNWKVTTISGVSNVDSLAAGDGLIGFVCAISGGKVYCWGENDFGQLGVDPRTTAASMTPLGPIPGLTGVTAVSAGGEFTCALTSGHRVFCWGANNFGTLGMNPDGPPGPQGLPPNQSFVPIEVTGW